MNSCVSAPVQLWEWYCTLILKWFTRNKENSHLSRSKVLITGQPALFFMSLFVYYEWVIESFSKLTCSKTLIHSGKKHLFVATMCWMRHAMLDSLWLHLSVFFQWQQKETKLAILFLKYKFLLSLLHVIELHLVPVWNSYHLM